MEAPISAILRTLPSVQALLEHPAAAALLASMSRVALADAIRTELAGLRAALLSGDATGLPDAADILRAAARPRPAVLRRAINATGIVVHTNLGRAPLAAEAIEAILQAAGACNLEYDLATGRRGARGDGAEALLCRLTAAAAALAVNNNAAALLLALTALAGGPGQDGEVIVSRGELVEIGGGFRIPDIIAQGGARLVEVGTTNRTRLADYAAAITPRTKMLLKVHQSNFRMVGFTSDASLAELAGLARARSLILVDDLGSGTLARLPGGLAPLEPTVRESLEAGTDLVAFSGDKLLGGPQAGLLAGRADVVAQLRRHPLMRALRLDKMALAALEATLALHADPEHARARVPVLRMLAQTEAVLQARAELLCALLDGDATIHATTGYAGGGALPGQGIASRAVCVAVPGRSPDALAAALRAQVPAVVGRIHDGRLLLDMLTVADAEVADLAAAIGRAAA